MVNCDSLLVNHMLIAGKENGVNHVSFLGIFPETRVSFLNTDPEVGLAEKIAYSDAI